MLYNAAKTYSLQLTGEERYERLKTVTSLKIADFEMFENQPEFLTRFVFKEKEQQFDCPDTEIELVFVELPKFSKELAQLETTADQWIYFLQNTSTLETIPETLSAVPEIQKALRIASEDNFTQEELNELQKQELWLQDQQIAIDLARDQVIKNRSTIVNIASNRAAFRHNPTGNRKLHPSIRRTRIRRIRRGCDRFQPAVRFNSVVAG